LKIVSIHQPGYLPWLGFFKKIMYSDIFVFLDDVKFVKRQWHNRNQILTKDGPMFLTVPIIKNSGENINEIKISYDEKWNINHKKSLFYNYNKSKFFEQYWDFFEKVYSKKFENLLELNTEIINFFIKELEIKTKIIFSSELGITEKKSELNLEICESLNADVYLSGIQGKNYLIEKDFEKKNIKIEYQNFQHPNYTQNHKSFVPNMAFVDLLFNEGKNSKKILENSNNF
jgi:hypothetical protein